MLMCGALLVGALGLSGCHAAVPASTDGGAPVASGSAPPLGDADAATCGDGTCEAAETCASCTMDCGACSSHSVALAWDASTTSGVTYNVYRSTVAGGPYSILLSAVSATAATDSMVSSGTTYYYVVRAQNSNGESANSDESSAMIP
jgi:hypothetical protein